MTAENHERALQRLHCSSEPTSPPLIYIQNADVEISLLPGDTHNIYLTSDLLRNTSWFFWSALNQNWVEEKVTGDQHAGNGTAQTMKRFELEFDGEGGNVLVGKVSLLVMLQRG